MNRLLLLLFYFRQITKSTTKQIYLECIASVNFIVWLVILLRVTGLSARVACLECNICPLIRIPSCYSTFYMATNFKWIRSILSCLVSFRKWPRQCGRGFMSDGTGAAVDDGFWVTSILKTFQNNDQFSDIFSKYSMAKCYSSDIETQAITEDRGPTFWFISVNYGRSQNNQPLMTHIHIDIGFSIGIGIDISFSVSTSTSTQILEESSILHVIF